MVALRSPSSLSEGRQSIRRIDFKHPARVVSEIFHLLCLGKQAGTTLASDLPELVGLAIRVLATGVAPYSIHPPTNCSSRPLLVSSTSYSATRFFWTVRSAQVADGTVLSFVTAIEGTSSSYLRCSQLRIPPRKTRIRTSHLVTFLLRDKNRWSIAKELREKRCASTQLLDVELCLGRRLDHAACRQNLRHVC